MSFKLRRVVVFALMAALTMLIAAPAQAHLQTKHDPDDSPGVFDIRTATFRHANGKIYVSMTVADDWSVEDLASGESIWSSFLRFQFNSKGGNNSNGNWTDYFVSIDESGGQVVGSLYRWVQPPYPAESIEFIQNVPANVTGRTVKTSFRKAKIHPRDTYIDWGADSQFTGEAGGCTSTCKDFAPDSGLFRHNL